MEKIKPLNISFILQTNFRDYALETISARALPDVRDGLKPVVRRIVYAMYELGLTHNVPYKKCARIVGDTMGKYHPHGDTSIYGALVRIAQDFRMRIPIVDGHGNFGTIDDSEAAMRYTEARLTQYGESLLKNIEKNCVQFDFNYDDSEKEPIILPVVLPNLLVNGCTGTAVAYTTEIPTHNLDEVVDAICVYIDKNGKIALDEIMTIIKGPDFPTGGIIHPEGIKECYETGEGKMKVRGRMSAESLPMGKCRIVITELPLDTSKEGLVNKLNALFESKEYLVDEIRDESSGEGIRIVIDLLPDAPIDEIVNLIYKKTPMEQNYCYKFVATVNGVPQQMGLLEYFEHFLKFRVEVASKSFQYDLTEKQKKLKVQNALILAAKNIKQVVSIMLASKTLKQAKEGLIKEFNIDMADSETIVNMRLSKVVKLEVNALESSIKEIEKEIKRIKLILGNKNLLMKEIKREMIEAKEAFGSPRKSTITNFNEISLKIETEKFTLQANGTKYKKLSEDYRGDRGITIKVSSTDIIYAFLKDGTVSKFSGLDANARDSEPAEIVSLFTEGDGELLFITTDGLIKKTAFTDFKSLPLHKVDHPALKLSKNATLVKVLPVTNGTITLMTNNNMGIKFSQDEIRCSGRIAGGIKGIDLSNDDFVVDAVVDLARVNPKLQKRGGKGLKLKRRI